MRIQKKKFKIYRERKVLSLFGFIIVNGKITDFIKTGKWFSSVIIKEQKYRVRYLEFDEGWSYQWSWGKWYTEWIFKEIIK